MATSGLDSPRSVTFIKIDKGSVFFINLETLPKAALARGLQRAGGTPGDGGEKERYFDKPNLFTTARTHTFYRRLDLSEA